MFSGTRGVTISASVVERNDLRPRCMRAPGTASAPQLEQGLRGFVLGNHSNGLGEPYLAILFFDNIRVTGYRIFMKKEAQLFKSLADETRLRMLWLLMAREELCVCDIMGVLGITQSKASRHLRYLYHLGWVTDRRDGVWMNYRLSIAPGSPEDKQLKLLAEILRSRPEAQALRDRLEQWLAAKQQSKDGGAACQCS
jgi:ArsR family transcriptional regulator, arsenate/arsenite/antimonite-responsive transcriptional repressor